jgi:hypothetical protein
MSLQTQALAKFLQNQCIATPPLVINIISSILHVGWCALQALHYLDVADFLILGMSIVGIASRNQLSWVRWIPEIH